jgi:hypothetical protein
MSYLFSLSLSACNAFTSYSNDRGSFASCSFNSFSCFSRQLKSTANSFYFYNIIRYSSVKISNFFWYFAFISIVCDSSPLILSNLPLSLSCTSCHLRPSICYWTCSASSALAWFFLSLSNRKRSSQSSQILSNLLFNWRRFRKWSLQML